MNGIVWLASYPKSGNTWFRTFLTNYVRDAERPADINVLDTDAISSSRYQFDEAVGYDSSELTWDEIDALRPEVYLYQAQSSDRLLYCKVHDAYTFLPDGRPLFPRAATHVAFYMIRNPLDVAVSFAHHRGTTNFDRLIGRMDDPELVFCGSRFSEDNQLRQRLLTWSAHVESWTGATEIPVHVVRYEDMKLAPEATFGAAVRVLGYGDDEARLRKAIAFSSFDELRAQEEKDGFHERAPGAKSFFRKGEVGSWREVLTKEQAERIVAAHSRVMSRFGYLDADGQIVF